MSMESVDRRCPSAKACSGLAGVRTRVSAAPLALFVALAAQVASAQSVDVLKDIRPGSVQPAPFLLESMGTTALIGAMSPENYPFLYAWNGMGSGSSSFIDFDPHAARYLQGEPPTVVATPDAIWMSIPDAHWSSQHRLVRTEGSISTTVTLMEPTSNGDGVYEDATPCAVGTNLLFFAFDQQHGLEPWWSDGTREGTRRLKDINPGLNGSIPYGTPCSALDSTRAIFTARTPETGVELWVTDGTEAGTRMIKDLAPGTGDSSPSDFVISSGLAYFGACIAYGNCGIWKTDGTTQGTVLVVDDVEGLAAVDGDWVAFVRESAATGRELWATNGTAAGTHLVADLAPGTAGSYLDNFTRVGSQLFFTAWPDSASGRKLYRTSAPFNSAQQVWDVSDPWDLKGFQDRLYFSADDTALGREPFVWKNGAASVLADVELGQASSSPSRFTPMPDGSVLLVGWRNGRRSVYRVAPSGTVDEVLPRFGESSGARGLARVGDGRAIFFADDGTLGWEPWVTDGTPSGTKMLLDIAPGSLSSTADSKPLTVSAGGVVFFAVRTPSYQLWRTDGTPGGTALIVDGYVEDFTTLGEDLFFVVDDIQHNDTIFKVGATGGPTSFKIPEEGARIHGLATMGDAVYFGTPSTSTKSGGIWRTDGTPAGTTLLKEVTGCCTSWNRNSMLPIGVHGQKLYFIAGDQALWETDGTSAGTVLLTSEYSWTLSSYVPFRYAAEFLGDKLVFVGADSESGSEPRVLDTQTGKIELLRDIVPGDGWSRPDFLGRLGDKLLFAAWSPSEHREYWVTDGTSEGTRILGPVVPGAGSAAPTDWVRSVVWNGKAFFAGHAPGLGTELLMTDGTTIQPAADILPGAAGSFPTSIATLGDVLLFTAEGPEGGELYALRDVTPPELTCPADRVVEATSSTGAVVTFETPTVHDAFDGAPTLTLSNSSPAALPVGESVITASASDASGNVATCSFTIRVTATNGGPNTPNPEQPSVDSMQPPDGCGCSDAPGGPLTFGLGIFLAALVRRRRRCT